MRDAAFFFNFWGEKEKKGGGHKEGKTLLKEFGTSVGGKFLFFFSKTRANVDGITTKMSCKCATCYN